MASALALVAAFLFALAAALQQKGALDLPHVSVADPRSLARLLGQTMWLLGTVALLCGYVLVGAVAISLAGEAVRRAAGGHEPVPSSPAEAM
jgi:hypothetical protein